MVYVNGNMFVHYERGNLNRHVSPDVFVVRGVQKEVRPKRRNYLVWEEEKAPDFVIELTSESTREADQTTKRTIYQDILRVREYFLFDPFEEYLHPRLQGYRLAKGRLPADPAGEGPAAEQGAGTAPGSGRRFAAAVRPGGSARLPIPPEVVEAKKRVEAENVRLRRELEELRRRLSGAS